jgi:hypothetical protein
MKATPREKAAGGVGKQAASGDLKAQIADELCTALERLGADEELLSVVSSWRDTAFSGVSVCLASRKKSPASHLAGLR